LGIRGKTLGGKASPFIPMGDLLKPHKGGSKEGGIGISVVGGKIGLSRGGGLCGSDGFGGVFGENKKKKRGEQKSNSSGGVHGEGRTMPWGAKQRGNKEI